MLLFHYRNESGSVKRDRGEAAYSRAAFISDSSENASKHAAMGEKVSGFQSGGSSVPHTCPQVPAAGSLPHATPRLLHSEAQVAEVSRQRVPPGSLLTLGAPRDAGRTDGQTHTHTYTRARGKLGVRARGEARYLAHGTTRRISGRTQPPPRRGRAIPRQGSTAPWAPDAAARLLFTAGVCCCSSGRRRRRLPAPG